ncbi:nucleotide-binding protein [Ruminococcus sp. CAG:579]|jgi:Mrp family chromosome partitioning ATPase|uniref:Mrp/NBP35 family ATP-binding protein n=1 Tax=Ruminococcus sp. 210702-SL.1.03 TaxID=2883233 RepID=UPI00033951E0|nr:Mrp/NBP35 family ATP-binding protein [Ruminococcus sp. 210702-SL.1.03]MCB6616822.1 Mrp/NBP35 family ATP-binding protein [Ruminococcus sp. 210702-SL.1.03]CDA72357.1 nucleotide-binding protein [Ruminococcus sp. CAG:579]
MSECTHDCSSCSQKCGEAHGPEIARPHEGSHIKKVIAVVSGKGGVGKSLVTSLMAVNAQRRGFKAAVLDADITGPSIPKVFGINGRAQATENALFPCKSKGGVSVMSLNLLTDNETDPVIWRGPVIAGAVTQFWTDVIWGDVDYMFVDMPPGTGDVPLTVFQQLPIEGIIVVTSPQELVSMIVAKALNMAKLMRIPVLGIVENMSYVKCPDCGKQIKVFGESHIDEIAAENGIEVLGKIPMIPEIAALCDAGNIEDVAQEYIPAADSIFEE